jgi:hypothetical protein
MSQIDTSGIDATFPVAGRDNDSRGFNDNFGAIKTALATAATELADLQAKALLKSQLTVNSSLDNNLGGHVISNGQYSQFSPVYADRGFTSPSSNDNTIDINNGPVQKFTLNDANTSGGDNFIWANWSSNSNQVSQVRLIFTGSTSTLKNVTFTRTDGGHNIFAVGFPSPLQVSSTNLTVVDAWTVDGGDHVYLSLVGVY